jgi:hypothetical protein
LSFVGIIAGLQQLAGRKMQPCRAANAQPLRGGNDAGENLCVEAEADRGDARVVVLQRGSGPHESCWHDALGWLDRPAPLADDSVLHVAETLQIKVDDALRAAIADVQQLTVHAAPFAAAQAARVVVALRPDAEILSLWLADAVLAARLKWPLPLPLIAGALLHPSLRTGGHRPYPGDADWTLTCCLAYGRAAAQACDLFAALGRSSQQLIAVAPRLRAKGAGAVIETLLDEDAVLPSARRGAMSARGMRRLFDRLVALGGVRELTGRSTFRLYGL